jgi:hypothetical protein
MKTQLDKFIAAQPKDQLMKHHMFLTQLFLLSGEVEKEENDGKPLTVFQVLLGYIAEIVDRDDPTLNKYVESLNEVIEKM